MKNFKGIKSTVKANDGKIIRSGQIVISHGRIAAVEKVEVFFEPNHGFKIQGNNLVDAYVMEVVRDVSMLDAIIGNIKLLKHNLLS